VVNERRVVRIEDVATLDEAKACAADIIRSCWDHGFTHDLHQAAMSRLLERVAGLWPAEVPPEPTVTRDLIWHKGRHVWSEHDGFPRHQHSINGALTIDPHDTSPHFRGGAAFK
jgi:hypothetical protein